MDLHANAALGLNRRRVLGGRVVDERWTPTDSRREAVQVPVRQPTRGGFALTIASDRLGLLLLSALNGTARERMVYVAAARREFA